MANLKRLVSAVPVGGVNRQRGVVVTLEDGSLGVNVWGNLISVSFADPLFVVEGDPVLVDITSRGAVGQSDAVVVAKLTGQPRPARGKILATPVGDTVSVLAEDGKTYSAGFAGSYAVGNWVFLNWTAGTPTVVGKVSETQPPPVVKDPASDPDPKPKPPPPPPPKPIRGRTSAAATRSGTHGNGLRTWDSWAGGRQNVFQGTWYGPALTGAWVYGSKIKALNDGRKIRSMEFRIPRRRSVGDYNATLTMRLFTHTSSSLPGGNVNLDDGPFNVTRSPREGADWVTLPSSFHARLLAGGGIAIDGGSYMGFEGRVLDPQSGLIRVYWEKS